MYDYVLSLDISLRDTGIALFGLGPFKEIWTGSFKTDPDDDIELRKAEVIHEVTQLALGFKLIGYRVAVVIEDYAFATAGGNKTDRAEIAGTCKYIFSTILGFDVYLVSPLSIKAFMGHGKFKKLAMRQAALENFGFYSKNDNIVDAYCLARYFIAFLNGMKLKLRKMLPTPGLSILQAPAKLISKTSKSSIDKKTAKP